MLSENERAYQREYRKRRYAEDPEWRARVNAHSAKHLEAKYSKRTERYHTDPEYRAKVLAAAKRYRKENPESCRRRDADKSRKTRAGGWTREEYEAALAAQGGVCKICGKPPKKNSLAADHCHKTGRKRALLCTACNVWIGVYEKDPALTAKRIAFIKKGYP